MAVYNAVILVAITRQITASPHLETGHSDLRLSQSQTTHLKSPALWRHSPFPISKGHMPSNYNDKVHQNHFPKYKNQYYQLLRWWLIWKHFCQHVLLFIIDVLYLSKKMFHADTEPECDNADEYPVYIRLASHLPQSRHTTSSRSLVSAGWWLVRLIKDILYQMSNMICLLVLIVHWIYAATTPGQDILVCWQCLLVIPDTVY